MTFGEKLKKLRTDNHLTQEELAEKIYVTRTAVSKWETDKGYPSIDSFKQLADLFRISIDELITDADVENKKLLDEMIGKRWYWCAVGCFLITLISVILFRVLHIPFLMYIGIAGVIGYVVSALLSKPKYKRTTAKNAVIPYVVSRLVILAVVLTVIVFTIISE